MLIEIIPNPKKTIEIVPTSGNSVTIEPKEKKVIEISKAGSQGLSAYDIAVLHGFIGTEEEWLESIGSGEGCECIEPNLDFLSSLINTNLSQGI